MKFLHQFNKWFLIKKFQRWTSRWSNMIQDWSGNNEQGDCYYYMEKGLKYCCLLAKGKLIYQIYYFSKVFWIHDKRWVQFRKFHETFFLKSHFMCYPAKQKKISREKLSIFYFFPKLVWKVSSLMPCFLRDIILNIRHLIWTSFSC